MESFTVDGKKFAWDIELPYIRFNGYRLLSVACTHRDRVPFLSEITTAVCVVRTVRINVQHSVGSTTLLKLVRRGCVVSIREPFTAREIDSVKVAHFKEFVEKMTESYGKLLCG